MNSVNSTKITLHILLFVQDMSVHLVYLAILLIIAGGLHDNRMYHFERSLTNMFQVGSKQWNNIKTRDDILNWFQGPMLDTLYGGQSSYFTDGQLLVISPPILRQQRIVQG